MVSSLKFKVQRCDPELVGPAISTPHELKPLSDIDDQEGLRFNVPFILIYGNEASMERKNPFQVLRNSLSQTLVFYYPFAGRLKEGPNRKLMVDCTGEGVMFIEAHADVTLHQFGHSMQPPFPCFDQLLFDVPATQEITNSPLLLIQVTRLKCGGLILVIRLNHVMSDGAGLSQFMNAWAEMARGAHKPSIEPVWRREILFARDPPSITCNHYEYDQLLPTQEEDTNMLLRSFFLGPSELNALRRFVPHHLLNMCTTFDVATACFWRCRTKALQIEPKQDVRMLFIVNARRFRQLIPVGYYGNAFVFPAAVTTAGELCENPLGYAIELINKVKNEVNEEYVHSVADLMVIKGRCLFTTVRSCMVSDLTRAKLREVDFGWGNTVYGGVAKAGAGTFSGLTSFNSYKNANGEEGILFPVLLPTKAMERFTKELDHLLGNQNHPNGRAPTFSMSSL